MYVTSSAAPAQDYIGINTQLMFTSGQTTGVTQCTNLQVLDDCILESTEIFTLQLISDDSTVVTITPSAEFAVVTIGEDPMDGRNQI